MARDFTTGSPMKTIFMFAIPMLLGNIFQQLYSTVDSIIVGNYEGATALAAVSASGSIQFLLVAIAFGFTAGMSVVVSQVFGARDYERMKRVFSTGFIFITCLSIVLAIFGTVIAEPILVLLKTPANIMPDSARYLKIMFMGMPFQFVYNMYASVLRAIGDSKTPLYFLIVAAVTNIILDILFVATFGMGVAGVAWATLLAQALSGFLCHLYVGKKVQIFKLGKGEWIFDRTIIGAIINYGLPSAVQQSVVSVGMMFVQSYVNYFGADMTAAFGVSNRIENFVTMPLMQFAMALSMFAGQNIGAGQEKRAKEGVKATITMQLIFGLTMAFVLPVIAPAIINLFGLAEDVKVVELASMGIGFAAKFLFIFGLFQALNQFHRGVGDTKFAMLASICMVVVRVPVTHIMVHSLQMGEISIWAGMVIGWCTVLSLNTIRYLTGGWRGKAFVSKRVTDTEKTVEA
ncbi:MAG: MATE family efflux transporter [Oscillospiraceae bacterium]|nr:MATE family efflux transporter [Oscillospiraceae bacterium]